MEFKSLKNLEKEKVIPRHKQFAQKAIKIAE